MKTIGENLKAIRKAKGVSQAELANRIGKAQSSIVGYENDEVQMSGFTVCDVAKALDESPNSLLGWEEKPRPKILSVLAAISSLNEDKRKTGMDRTRVMAKDGHEYEISYEDIFQNLYALLQAVS